MYSDQDVIELSSRIAHSRKYRNIYEKTIERIVRQCLQIYGKKSAEDAARNILHQIWGAYYEHKPNFKALLDEIKGGINNRMGYKECVLRALLAQSSTRERVPLLDSFYKEIFSATGYPDSVIDHACGLNPLTIFWMDLPKDAKYYAFDIDKDQINFLRMVLSLMGLKDKVEVNLGDIFVDEFAFADVVFMLKLLPILEKQQKGSSLEIMKRQLCHSLVVSFPIKSLSGAEKGMTDFYSKWFKDLMKSSAWAYEEIFFKTELVFVVHKS